MKLLSDITRCYGTAEPVCHDCARRLQIERDDPKRWYPHTNISPIRGRCEYKITEQQHERV